MVFSVQESNVQAQPAKAPRATVIIPAYNAEATLAKAIRSAQAQTERNIEIIVIDDCSPDGTFAVAQSFEKQDSRVHAFRLPENRGKSCAMNFARAKAKGEWIAFLDSDDWYAPTRLERLINAAEKHGVDMAGGNHVQVDIKAHACIGTAFPARGEEKVIGLDDFLKGSNSTAAFDYGMLLPVFRAGFIRAHKLDYYEPARFGEDFYVLLDYFMAGGKGVIVDDPLYYYIVPFGTISRQWAHERRSRYNYELSQNIHRHFTEKHDAQMTPLQRRLMARRGRGIDAMISFHQVRENLDARKYTGAILCLFKAPFQFWKTVAQRVIRRLKENLLPRPCGTPLPE